MLNNLKIKVILIATLFLVFPPIVSADATLGEKVSFFVDSSFDADKRTQIGAQLQKITSKLYIYIDDAWWNSLTFDRKQEINSTLSSLVEEFESKIYPTLTSTFGSEPKPGIDGDEKITILIHMMKKEAGGYFNSGNEYDKLQNPNSNEREMVYLNSDYIFNPILKSFLAHEFMHLINFNQKDKMRGAEEEVWLNELRADYAPTLLGYDSEYEGSNLQRRVNEFLKNPSDSLTDWQSAPADYGALNLFSQYLVDHYGVKILVDSLESSKKGIESINYALLKAGFKEDFSQIFTDWVITVLVNNCNIAPYRTEGSGAGLVTKYCYLNPNLKNLKLVPLSNFLPLNSDSVLSVNYLTKNWSANWYKIFGGGGTLTFEFNGINNGNFKVPYLLCDSSGSCSVNFLNLNENQDEQIIIKDFNTKYTSLTIIPSVQNQNNISGNFSFSWSVKVNIQNQEEELLINKLQFQLEALKTQIAWYQNKINEILDKKSSSTSTGNIPSGFIFKKNLSFGMSDSDVVYLKMILDKEINHEKWSGNDYFGSKTLEAIKVFQKKYKAEISTLAGYEINCTGFVGTGTRAKLNKLLGY